ncbi:thermonuclease family protein [Roseomonas sp. CECT 9278]|uniref:thermonuclease family protein n=1 Tax=Roseomonas sp. CECT 9278 TaxID=2845823 RepID=UPI001E358FAE|nr:thermonuclease family protein [Roseomonas sp. CECT 9278]
MQRLRVRLRLPWWLRWPAALALAGCAVAIGWQAGLILPVTPLPRVTYGIPEGAPAPAAQFTARVGVVDGDTLSMGGERLRIHGIDAPEMAQICDGPRGRYPCGEAARAAMAGVVGRGVVACRQLDTDQYRRRIVRCHDEQGRDIGAELVRQGWALAFTRYATDYVAQEAAAREARRGLWDGRFDAPWDWRARHRP